MMARRPVPFRVMLENATASPACAGAASASIPKGCAVPRRDAEHLVGVKLCRKKHNKHKRQTCEKAAHKAYPAAAKKR